MGSADKLDPVSELTIPADLICPTWCVDHDFYSPPLDGGQSTHHSQSWGWGRPLDGECAARWCASGV